MSGIRPVDRDPLPAPSSVGRNRLGPNQRPCALSNRARSKGAGFLLLLLAWMMILPGCQLAGSRSPQLQIETNNPGNAITANAEENQLILDVRSDPGFGWAKVALIAGAWPAELRFRLHLPGLEEMQFVYGGTQIILSVNSRDGQLRESAIIGTATELPLVAGDPQWMSGGIVSGGAEPYTIPLQDGYFEISAPREFLEGDFQDFQISWIDFYR